MAATPGLDAQTLRLTTGRRPAVPIVLSFAVGIVADGWFPAPLFLWIGIGVVLLLAAILCNRKRPTWAVACLLAGCAMLGAARHNLHWSAVGTDDVSRFATDRPALVRLTGTVLDRPRVLPRKDGPLRSAWPQSDRSVCSLRCGRFTTDKGGRRVSGRVRLEVNGLLTHVRPGDEIEVVGHLSRPSGPRNPGDFDFREYLRRQGIRGIVRTRHPGAVHVTRRNAGEFWRPWRASAQSAFESVLTTRLSSETAPIAVALLLGSRSQLETDVRTAFAESGTMHLLAISGLHVGMLAWFLWIICRLGKLAPPTTSLVLLAVVVAYAFVTEGRPPVVRAAILISIWTAGIPWHRSAPAANTLALAGLVVLILNPADLFDVGAQLSFLAVATILFTSPWTARLKQRQQSWEHSPVGHAAGVLQIGARRFGTWLTSAYLVTAAIWFFAAPWVIATFHLISPVGLLVNILLIPVVGVALAFGYVLLIVGVLLPPLAALPAWVFDLILKFVLWSVGVASRLEMGHFYVPSPPLWWLLGFYFVLIALMAGRLHATIGRIGWRCLAVWTVLGLAVGLAESRPAGLRCTFLSVGHGGAILIEMPGGKTLLYDAGMINDGDRARQAVQNALWERGRTRIDAVIVSHADVDHFNGIPGLMSETPVGCLLAAPSFLDFEQEGVATVCETAAAEGIPIRLLAAGDRIPIDPQVMLHVLHPAIEPAGSSDNANSIVMSVEFAGRRLLLTGDLEDEGLANLLSQGRRRGDVLLAPHHGSLGANSSALAEWAEPRWVVVSAGRRLASSTLKAIYAPACVLHTHEVGAVTFEIDPDGNVTCHTVRPNE